MSSEDDRRSPPCVMCGRDTSTGMQWILLNRYVLGTGRTRSMITTTNDDGEYWWEVTEGENNNDIVTGPVLCWPICASMHIEGRIAEARVEERARYGAGDGDEQ